MAPPCAGESSRRGSCSQLLNPPRAADVRRAVHSAAWSLTAGSHLQLRTRPMASITAHLRLKQTALSRSPVKVSGFMWLQQDVVFWCYPLQVPTTSRSIAGSRKGCNCGGDEPTHGQPLLPSLLCPSPAHATLQTIKATAVPKLYPSD